MRDRREEIGRLADRILRNNLSFSEMEAQVAPDDADFLRLDAEQNAVRCLRIRDIVHRCHASKSRSPEQPLSVLETGIGYGYVTTCLRESFGDSIAMYALEHPGREYIERPAFQEYLLEERIQLQTRDLLADEVPWDGLAFDAIILSEVLEHIPPTAAPDLIRRLARRLAPDGCLVMTSPNLHSLHRRINFMLGRGRLFDLATPLEFAPGTYGHIMIYGRPELSALLDHAGLRLSSFGYLNWEHIYLRGSGFESKALHWAQKHLPTLMPRLSTTWIAVAAQN
jgi:SAM-dependent methyltransferase